MSYIFMVVNVTCPVRPDHVVVKFTQVTVAATSGDISGSELRVVKNNWKLS
jgi:hypothetical protein